METLRRELALLLGGEPAEIRSVAGGDIGQGFRIAMDGGEILFAKSYSQSSLRAGRSGTRAAKTVAAEMVAAEAQGLAWLAEASAIRVPEVLAVSDSAAEFALLVMEWIEPGDPVGRTDEDLGRGLARLHASGAPGFGLGLANFIGWLPQSNEPAESWADFYRDRRLAPLLDRARDAGLLSGDLEALADQVLDRLPDLVGPAEPPARLHGDLWGGNWLIGSAGEPVLIDPAVYGGHREIDLAMMRLFGGFSDRVFAAYAEAAPLAEGHAERVPLHQLYPLLVHLNLFGSGYASSVEQALRAYVR
jgi:fructosamine-3-kinase